MEEKVRFWEKLFLCVIDELRKRQNGTLYDIIRASGLLRQLFIDGDKSLIHRANKKECLKIKFLVRDNSSELYKMPDKWWGRLYPINRKIPIELSLNKFLKWPICIYEEHTYTVYDLIDYFSHFLGGIHAGLPSDEKQNTFTLIHKAYPHIKDMPSISLYGILEVSICALKPLEDAIKGRTNTGGLEP
ncbi:hypothetical protein [Flavisolibacter ginsengisoli]|jgi:hypothetical protein|uniref:Uncharacterized protein n=1 Tax=Flavisolibacter ginsengisoli DSM 18119 TaxID=1121884 RepID=A0A1M4WTA4_9BACT|nr:hypothetical protein [Flavisolibacter ginsengisoli]SHE84430.1 hypothetical protein SAMN02745131_01214 [Flavisolibacter ginsengisoli DSM 18119]